MKRTACVILLLGLAGCAGTAATKATVSVAISCDAIGTSLQQAASLNSQGKLSPAQIEAISTINSATKPVCSGTSAVDPAAVEGFVEAEAANLKTLVGK